MACVESNGETAPLLKMCDTFVSITSPGLVYSHYTLKMATIELVTDVKGQGSTNMIQLPFSFGSQLMCSTYVSDSSKVDVQLTRFEAIVFEILPGVGTVAQLLSVVSPYDSL